MVADLQLPVDEITEVFGPEPVDVARLAVERIYEPVASASAGIWRVRTAERSAVLKLIAHSDAGHVNWRSGEDPSHWYYWRREVLAYESGLLASLTGGLRAPRCYLVAPRGDGSVALWIEDLGDASATRWNIERYGLAARHLGRTQGRYVTEVPLPDQDWLSRGWLRAYLTQRDGDLDLLDDPTAWRDPRIAACFPRPPIERAQTMRHDQPRFLDALRQLPPTLCHLDLHPANLFADGEDATAAIDWSFVGLGAIGEDAGNLVPDAVLDFHVPAARIDDLYAAVATGYEAGLRQAGWDGPGGAVRLGMAATIAAKYAWILPALLRAAVDDREHVNGRPFTETLRWWTPVIGFLLDRADEARRAGALPLTRSSDATAQERQRVASARIPSDSKPSDVTGVMPRRNPRHNIQQSARRTLAGMIHTLRLNIKDPYRRKAFGAKLGGKMIGLALVVVMIYAFAWFFSTEAASATPVHSAATDLKVQLQGTINGLNTAWVLITAFLVFFMQAGFMMLEGGFARTREVSNIMIECIVDTALCGVLFYAFGFAFMFGPGNGWIGYHYFFLQGVPHTYTYGGLFDTGVAFMAFFLFQFAFADTASTIVSGAMVGRTAFKGDLLYSLVVSGFIYPIFGHWIWGPAGWLGKAGVADLGDTTPFRDFAGSTVVHTVGGVLALCGAIALGPRLGRKFKRDGGGMPPGHNMTLAALGAVILWFGWYGFNPGSTLSAIDFEGIGRVATNTTLAACAGALVAVAWAYPRSKKWDVGISINGLLAGLVAITCPCYWVSPTGSLAIGAIAGVIMILIVDFTEWVRVDDPCGAFAVHGACGIFGTLSLGFFAVGNYGGVTGILYGGNTNQLVAQVKGSAVIIAATAAAGLLLMFGIKAIGMLRISEAEELEGLDIAEHGAPAYHPEYAYMGYSPIPAALEGTAPGINTAPPSDIHLPVSE